MSNETLLSHKMLAYELKLSYATVSQMRRRGLVIPTGGITLEEARQWLKENDNWRSYPLIGKKRKCMLNVKRV